jgi:hypothetical protein
MSKSATITILLDLNSNDKFEIKSIIKDLKKAGWVLYNNGIAAYLPQGDNGDYNWIDKAISEEELIDILVEKEIIMK